LTGKDEIKIQKLIGATNYFILLPILFVEVIQIIIALFLAYNIYQLTLKHFNLLLTRLLSIIEAKITLIELSHLDIVYISGLVIVLTIITTYTSVGSILAKNTNY
jgi:cell division protein FtsX